MNTLTYKQAVDLLGVATDALREIAAKEDPARGNIAKSVLGIIDNRLSDDMRWELVAKGAPEGVTVTMTPAGRIADVAVDGHSVGSRIPARGAELTLRPGDVPLLSMSLVVDEITVQTEESAR